ncbi:expressed tetratricopeptide repeat protein [Nitzschia inconspicua]|uniref:Expressed tetratricopeptide repeat protein n=1 Tax=Nitzschia inconspicua TaxID=303405 RepID=A0A9K3KM53_9STRA|nr:expressed tetratricopeptide repeat protein [Nitzschia inconspicua]
MARISPDISGDGTTPSTWVGWKERGKVFFQTGNHEAALNAYTQALRPEFHCPLSEQQNLWSNIVACRLKIGGSRAQAEAAVEAAKQCVALNDAWAKGHVRLASAYIALGGHSNDACNALQRALQLDPGNRTARDMLVRELRRDRVTQNQYTDAAATSFTSSTSPSAPPEDLDDREYSSQSTGRDENTASHPGNQATPPPPNHRYNHNDDIDNDVSSWRERLEFYAHRAKHWYSSQNDDIKTALKILLGLIALYIAFGGRFGLEYLSSTSSASRHKNHISNNDVYQEFYQDRRRRQYREQQARSGRNTYDPYEGTSGRGNSFYSSSRRRGNTWSGDVNSYVTMMIMAGVAYIAHRNGINPFQALVFANMAMGRGGHRRRGFYNPGFGHGGMMGGFRRGGGRPRW